MIHWLVIIGLGVASLAGVYLLRSWFSRRTLWRLQYRILLALMLLQKTLPRVYLRLRNSARRLKGVFEYVVTHLIALAVGTFAFVLVFGLNFLHENTFREKQEAIQNQSRPLKIETAEPIAPRRSVQHPVIVTPSSELPTSTSEPPYETGEVNNWTLTLLVFAVGGFVFVVILWPEILFDARPKNDELAFQNALQEWKVLLAKKLKTVRELKRFENQARFLALALRSDARDMGQLARLHETCCQKLGEPMTYPAQPAPLSDKIIVGVTAWLYCGGDVGLLRSGELDDIVDMITKLDATLTSDLQEHHKQHGAPAFRDAMKTLAALYWGTHS